MWLILHSYRAESASYICKVCEESIGYEKREDRNEVSMAIILWPISLSTKVLMERLCLFMMTISLKFMEFF